MNLVLELGQDFQQFLKCPTGYFHHLQTVFMFLGLTICKFMYLHYIKYQIYSYGIYFTDIKNYLVELLCTLHNFYSHLPLLHHHRQLSTLSTNKTISFLYSSLFISLCDPSILHRDVCVTVGLQLYAEAEWAWQEQPKKMIPSLPSSAWTVVLHNLLITISLNNTPLRHYF